MPKPTLLRPPSTPAELEASMIFVEGGEFWMGSDEDHSFGESPRHKVRLSDFEMSRFPVSQALWESVMGHNPAHFEHPNRPVEMVSWEDIMERFLPKLHVLTGKSYRVPTEAEWEYAAQGGRISQSQMGWADFPHSGGERMHELGWYLKNARQESAILGAKCQNPLGLKEMNGNVWEWSSNRHMGFDPEKLKMPEGRSLILDELQAANLDTYYQQCFEQGVAVDPLGPSSGSYWVNRGGGWSNKASNSRVAFRDVDLPDDRFSVLGFRLSRTP
ncbi:formylglycine-generating enzyme family protein [Pontibacter sp. G13]|uniref:formylglycine-generating enzyme family protein n=1 Tax=Pontibacter sp. G13 TaxID=3074898 RepID=UPI00288C0455|nr:formylglycine-generating enzyme family protein [Pontibacter sp. G13]WNJ18739.1 formylglycine-generating enzyme family protein [Pontibacter sp. G13]